MPSPWPQGHEIAARSGLPVLIGAGNTFDFVNQRITLTRSVYYGRDAISVLVAFHELRHSQQPLWWHLLRWIPAIRWLEEQDAWIWSAQRLADLCADD